MIKVAPDRQELIVQAENRGIGEHVTKRLPTYAIQNLIVESDSKDNNDSVSELSVSSAKSDVKHEKQGQGETTMVYMGHLKTGENVIDTKHKRFKFLIETKKDLQEAMDKNKQILETRREQLDYQDIRVLEDEISNLNMMFNLACSEIAQIRSWFNIVHEQKSSLYQTILEEAIDTEGRLNNHFFQKSALLTEIYQEIIENA